MSISTFLICLIVWCALFFIFTIIEMFTFQLVPIWFGIGSLGSFVAALFDAPILVQVIIFFLISAILIIFIRPIAARLMKGKSQPTNVDMLINREGLVTIKIDNLISQGRVNVFGQDWSARSKSGESIDAGEIVIINKIEGVTLIVDKKEI